MHLEVLVEDQSGSRLLEALLPKILGQQGCPHTWRVKAYRGVGHIPKGLKTIQDPAQRHLLDQLPRLLAGYGRVYPEDSNDAAVVVVVDSDRNDCRELLDSLARVLDSCPQKPKTLFRLAIEECEAWLLGDRDALSTAYPNARVATLSKYVQDSVCGTWEVLADVVYPGGSAALKRKPYYEAGRAKSEWAERIGPCMDVSANRSPSFGKLRDGLLRLANPPTGTDCS